MPPETPTGLVAALITALAALRAALVGGAPCTLADLATAYFADTWIERATRRLARLARRLEAGPLKPLGQRRTSPAERGPPIGLPAARLPLPRAPGWLACRLPIGNPAIQAFHAALAAPGFQTLLIQEPARFGRILRPLCRALGIPPPAPIQPPGTPRTLQSIPFPFSWDEKDDDDEYEEEEDESETDDLATLWSRVQKSLARLR